MPRLPCCHHRALCYRIVYHCILAAFYCTYLRLSPLALPPSPQVGHVEVQVDLGDFKWLAILAICQPIRILILVAPCSVSSALCPHPVLVPSVPFSLLPFCNFFKSSNAWMTLPNASSQNTCTKEGDELNQWKRYALLCRSSAELN